VTRGERVSAIATPARSRVSVLCEGSRLLDADDRGNLALWDLTRRERVWSLSLGGDEVLSAALDPGGRHVWLGLRSGFFTSVDLEGRASPEVPGVLPILRVAIDERGCWTQSERESVCWSLETGARIRSVKEGSPQIAASTARVTSPRGWTVYGTDDGWVRRIDAAGEHVLLPGGRRWGADSPVAAIALHPSQPLIAIAHAGSHGLVAVDAETGAGLSLEGPAQATRCAAFSADGRWLVAGYDDGVARAWDLSRR
jgi:WD40 repeat protein